MCAKTSGGKSTEKTESKSTCPKNSLSKSKRIVYLKVLMSIEWRVLSCGLLILISAEHMQCFI